ncbi:bifunctional 4-hydroxyphenylacetate degradation enzyme [Fusarium tjaetaba]|uniref:Bifunctional 4-hydroxyphenylacetate degradation enzyme n=1 Tax=Fusarium tjaetaba TaxID=1567544 RepID=A0A8H5S0J0_9HYPO|nr:bifunctional 4-hydroxyphenylacetate degradation enzyme [Fusarium tjaetaba]KAF5643359.1 bifunctional 4-hydroxyphenylacetate degradation enzyme [Fusarium tjaetaba]
MSSNTASFGLATIRNAHDDLEAAMVTDQWVYPLATLDASFQSQTIFSLLQDWSSAYSSLQRLASCVAQPDGQLMRHRIPLKEANFDTPIRYPNKLLAVGANYASHLKEMGLSTEKWDPMPFFSCPPTSSIVGPGKTAPFPPATKQFDGECELTVVMGKGLRNATAEEAAEAIAGYTIGLDLSCRDLFQTGPQGLVDIIRGKAQPGMKPCGPIFWPKECIGNLNNVPLRLWLNGDLMMDGTTSEMIRSPAEYIAEMSQLLPLDPGDMIMTGTPSGSARFHGNRWLVKGDFIKAQIGNMEPLEVKIY